MVLSTALVQKPAYIAIDEPESHLHPSLQIEFLTTLASYAKHGVLFSTHSVGLARSTAEKIYAVQKIAAGNSMVREFDGSKNLVELLGNLSYSTISPLGYSKLLLVEGATEIKVFQQFLRKLGSEKDITMVPLGGTQLIRDGVEIELTELIRLVGDSNLVSVIIDSERADENDPIEKSRQAFLDLCKKLGISTHATKFRATENYFSDIAVKSALGQNFCALDSYAKLSDSKNGWAKADNWRIASKENLDDFLKTDLGEFLKSVCDHHIE